MKNAIAIVVFAAACGVAFGQAPQASQSPPGGRGGRGGGGFANAYPQRPPADPEVVARGKAIYGAQCNFCHGSDARGGEGGPNLLRSQLVLSDQQGEKIAPVVQNGRPDQGMPKFDLTTAQISDIAAYIHSFRVGGYDISREKPASIVVGDAKSGEAYFKAKCASCHSVTGDLKGFGAKFEDPKQLQQTWIMPGAARGGVGGQPSPPVPVPPTTASVTTAAGSKVEGRLVAIDDFLVVVEEADGVQRTIPLNDSTKVEIHDPLEPHRQLLPVYTDKDIHDVTAYLVGLK